MDDGARTTKHTMPLSKKANGTVLKFDTQGAWADWLAEHHLTSPGVWLQLAKKSSRCVTPTYAEALDSALCHGWIDGQKLKLDDDYWLQKFTPRRPDSLWSEVNCKKALDLISKGLMQPAGRAVIDAAKANGRWDSAYGAASHSELLPDLEEALRAHPKAEAFFRTLNARNRYAILFRLRTAKKPETRAARLQKFLEMLERGETLH